MTTERLAEMAGGRVAGDPGVVCRRVGTDSRSVSGGELFVALSGPNFNGHDFVGGALAAGALAAMVADHEALRWPDANLIVVPDSPLAGLQRLAAAWRRSLPVRVVGVTGSNGKTSVKDMCAAVLGAQFSTLATSGNLNNGIGVPLTLLRLDAGHEFAVIEMGMNHAGEIAPLAGMAAPEIGVVTNVGRAHIEFLGSRKAIAIEKSALVRALPADGVAILPAADDFIETLRHGVRARVVLAGVGGGDVAAIDPRPDGDGMVFRVEARGRSLDCRVPLPGVHMVHNAALAIALGLEAGVPLEACRDALACARLTGGRLERKVLAGVVILDDSYNANPDSMKAAIEVLGAVRPGRRWAVLGAMGELGEHSAAGHAEVGWACAEAALDGVIVLGADASGIARAAEAAGVPIVREAEGHEAAARLLAGLASPGDTVLLKGSRAARTEMVLPHFSKLADPASSAD